MPAWMDTRLEKNQNRCKGGGERGNLGSLLSGIIHPPQFIFPHALI